MAEIKESEGKKNTEITRQRWGPMDVLIYCLYWSCKLLFIHLSQEVMKDVRPYDGSKGYKGASLWEYFYLSGGWKRVDQ